MTTSRRAQDERYAQLLVRRVSQTDVKVGRGYVIHARNGGVGIAVKEGDRLGYEIHREKGGDHSLFVEYDWDEGPPFGTAIPLAAISDEPPEDEAERLAWLSDQETMHAAQIDEAWQTVLGFSILRK